MIKNNVFLRYKELSLNQIEEKYTIIFPNMGKVDSPMICLCRFLMGLQRMDLVW